MFVQSSIFHVIYTFLIVSHSSGSGMLSNGRGKGTRYLCTSTGTLWDVGMESLDHLE